MSEPKTAEVKVGEIISDDEIARVHGRADFGSMSPREVVNDGVRKAALGYHSGHTQFCILREHGLITGPRSMSHDYSLTKKGKKYARALMHDLLFRPASPPAETGEGFTSLDGLWKNPALSRLERVKAHRSEFGSDLKTALEAVDEESGRQSIAAAAQPVSPSEGEAVGVDLDELRSIIHSATHQVLPLADDVTGLGIQARATMQVEIADHIIANIGKATLYTHPASDQSDTERMRAGFTVDDLAQEIRRVDGNHSLGAGALAEALMSFLSAALAERAADQ